MRTKREFHFYTGMWLIAVLILVVLLWQNVGDARIINYSGLVRGATQRLVKEELNGQPDDGLISRLDGIIYDLQTGEGEYGLAKNSNREFQRQLTELDLVWGRIKVEIYSVRSGTVSGDHLYDLSQQHFEMADRLVLQAEQDSNHKLTSFIAVYFSILLLSVAVFIVVNRRNQKSLQAAASTDKLTGLLNRTGFETAAEQLLRQHPKRQYVIVEFDVNHFKVINDSIGYALGDQLLVALASALSHWREGLCLCARIDADDFVLLGEKRDTLIFELETVLEQAMRELSFLDSLGGVGFTFGAYEMTNDGEQIKTVMDKANTAHKTAKVQKSKTMVWYDEQLLQRLKLERGLKDRLHHGLTSGEFKLYLQPRVELSALGVVGAEALVRWDLPGRGTLYPDSFIPLFEENGSIPDLDFYMLQTVCAYLHGRQEQGLELFPISVNFSRVTLYHPAFYQTFREIVDRFEIPHDCIELEVTESAFNEIADVVLQALSRLDDEGFPISMDDFGSGYSSLSLLGRLPLQIIKLDKAFLREADENESVKGIIICAVELAHTMGVQIVCEGAEEARHVRFLQEIGCDYVQGYYFTRPIPQEAFDRKYPYFEQRAPLPPRRMLQTEKAAVPNWEKRIRRMFEATLVETYPGFLTLRNEQHQIVYLNQNFRHWLAQYTDVDPLGKTTLELAAVVPENVADAFLHCNDGIFALQTDSLHPHVMKKLLEFKGAAGTDQPTQYYDALKYWVTLDGVRYLLTIAYDVTERYHGEFNLHHSLDDGSQQGLIRGRPGRTDSPPRAGP